MYYHKGKITFFINIIKSKLFVNEYGKIEQYIKISSIMSSIEGFFLIESFNIHLFII